jgi:acetyl-CoA carboxylase biotin carboxyl carrier protein
MEFKEIQELIRMVSKSNLAEVRIEKDTFKITIRTREYYSPASKEAHAIAVPAAQPILHAPVVTVPAAQQTPAEKAASEKSAAVSAGANLVTIKSPMVGTFYRSAGPDKDPFVKVGDEIKQGTVLCVIEAMKLFNEIESEVNGIIVKILVDNSKPVEYDQPLFLVEPS